jgi:hypothetical protein
MGLDNLVDARDRQIVDKDVETGEWGLTEQIENSARGHIPDDPQLLLQRMDDEQVRQALDRGCDRSDIIDVLGISRRTTFNKEKRACAYDFPLDAFNHGGRPTDGDRSERSTTATDTPAGESEEQQRLDGVAEQDSDSLGRAEAWETPETEPDTQPPDENVVAPGETVSERDTDEELRVHLQHAIDALQEVDDTLRG